MEPTAALETFRNLVRKDLQHLYNPGELRRSELLEVLGVHHSPDKVAGVRKVLQEAIQALKPAEKTPLDSNARRIYEILSYRFIEQLNQKAVAADMSISTRQLQRLEAVAVEVLADSMLEHYAVDLGKLGVEAADTASAEAIRAEEAAGPGMVGAHGVRPTSPEENPVSGPSPRRPDEGLAPRHRGEGPAEGLALRHPDEGLPLRAPAAGEEGPPDSGLAHVERELDWLRRSATREVVELAGLVENVLRTLDPVRAAQCTAVECNLPAGLPPVLAHLTSLRQALLNLFSSALRLAPGGQVTITASLSTNQVHLAVTGGGMETVLPTPELENILTLSTRLVELSGGVLTITRPPYSVPQSVQSGPKIRFQATLTLPAFSRMPVLVIDDNTDMLQLLERYLTGTRYQFRGLQDPAAAVELVAELNPRIIVLDVMLPGIDGWELLGRIKRNPATQDTAVVISTFIPQKSLAQLLGADGFLQKPFSREEFLAELERLANLWDPG